MVGACITDEHSKKQNPDVKHVGRHGRSVGAMATFLARSLPPKHQTHKRLGVGVRMSLMKNRVLSIAMWDSIDDDEQWSSVWHIAYSSSRHSHSNEWSWERGWNYGRTESSRTLCGSEFLTRLSGHPCGTLATTTKPAEQSGCGWSDENNQEQSLCSLGLVRDTHYVCTPVGKTLACPLLRTRQPRHWMELGVGMKIVKRKVYAPNYDHPHWTRKWSALCIALYDTSGFWHCSPNNPWYQVYAERWDLQKTEVGIVMTLWLCSTLNKNTMFFGTEETARGICSGRFHESEPRKVKSLHLWQGTFVRQPRYNCLLDWRRLVALALEDIHAMTTRKDPSGWHRLVVD